jgi:hypothetical protein
MRTVLAAAAAGALILGSASGAAVAKGKPETKPAPQSTVKPVKLQSVSIKGHKPIDLAKVTDTSAIKLRAKVLGKKQADATVAVTLGVYEKRVGGTLVTGSETLIPTSLAMRVTKPKRVSFFAGDAVITQVWTEGQIGELAKAVEANGKAFICIASADLLPVTNERMSMGVKKRLGEAKGKAVRDCVKVINSNTTPEDPKS